MIQCAVFGIAGPVFGGCVSYQLNVSHWCPIREKDIEEQTGLPKVKMLNDFVANGYGMIDLKEEEKVCIYEPSEGKIVEDKVRLVVGVGTGLGICQLTRASEDEKYFAVYPSEGGIVRIQLYSESDQKLQEYFISKNPKHYQDVVQMFLSGRGLVNIFEFLAETSEIKQESKLIKDKQGNYELIQADDITKYARDLND